MRIRALIEAGKLASNDIEEIEAIFGDGANPIVQEAELALSEKIGRLREGFYGKDQVARDWESHLRSIRRVLRGKDSKARCPHCEREETLERKQETAPPDAKYAPSARIHVNGSAEQSGPKEEAHEPCES